jgi:hypothetical protein
VKVIERVHQADIVLSSGRSMAKVLSHRGEGEQTLHRARSQPSEMKPEQARWLKALEVENGLRKRLATEPSSTSRP